MSYQALYRVWRPQRFDEIVRQQVVTQTLKKVYKMRDNLKVSYLTAIFFFIVAIIYANLA